MRLSTLAPNVFSSHTGFRTVTVFNRQMILVFAVITVAISLRPANAIEMFTFFGDGSRVPLPSLETPIEAYPGIPLRSDRLRARRQARYQVPPQAGMPVGNGRITIQAMPGTGTSPNLDDGMSSAAAPETIRTPPPTQTRRIRWRRR